MPVALVTNELILPGGGMPVRCLVNNSRRVFVHFETTNQVGFVLLAFTADGTFATAFADLAQTVELILLRHDLGELVESEMFLGDGGGNGPRANVTIIEGILIEENL